VFTPVRTSRVSGAVVHQIKQAIRDGQLGPGDQLPPERDLTQQLGVSRVSVRDALRTLEAHGLIEVRVGARGGAFVTAPAPELVGEGLANMLLLASITPAEVTEARRVFELAMLDLACERATEDDLEALDEICVRAEDALASGEYDVKLSAEFHARLARCTHNAAVALFTETLHDAVVASLEEARRADPTAGAAGVAEHRALVAAIRERDAARAREIMVEHLGRTAARVAAAQLPA
jgi:GntR family transcriptional repressor for pyruvate dehydrogenase complex